MAAQVNIWLQKLNRIFELMSSLHFSHNIISIFLFPLPESSFLSNRVLDDEAFLPNAQSVKRKRTL